MQPDRFTIKIQEALQAAQRLADERRNPADHARAPARRPARAGRRRRRARCCASSASTRPPCGSARPRARGAAAADDSRRPRGARRRLRRADPDPPRRRDRDARAARTSTSPPSICCSRSPAHRGAAGEVLRAAGAGHDELLKALAEVRGAHRVTDQNPEDKFQALEKYGRDLTEAAAAGKLDPVIGRDDEIRRVIQVLSPAHEEQSRADRRARRRQDRDRRGARPADRLRRRARGAARTAAWSRSTSAR